MSELGTKRWIAKSQNITVRKKKKKVESEHFALKIYRNIFDHFMGVFFFSIA